MRTTGRAADRDQKRRSGSYDLPFLADRAKKGVTGKEGYEGNGLSRRRQGFKSPWGRQRNHALTRNRKGFFRFEAFSKNVRAPQRLFSCGEYC